MNESWIRRELVFIRHGQTAYNLERRMQGQLDIPLNETGKTQAADCGRLLKTIEWASKPEVLISSDLCRASETAEHAAAALGLPVMLDSRLRELMLGDWQGLMVEEAAALSGDGIDPTIDAPIGRPDNAETTEQVAERVTTLLQEVAASGKSTVLVSHGGTLQIATCLLLGQDISHRRQFSFGSASVTRFAFGEDGVPVLLSFGLSA